MDRDVAFWVFVVIAFVVVGTLLDMFWGSL